MKMFSYVIPRDYGFAPNPFGKYCTLATCKPIIRRSASVGDWILGVGSKSTRYKHSLIFAMKVTNKINYNDYYYSDLYNYKKPVMNGSLKKMYGDNIYCFDAQRNEWNQLNSHHSNEDGSINYLNLEKDTQTDSVLISEYFYYFGRNAIVIPLKFRDSVIKSGQGHKIVEEVIGLKFIDWLKRYNEIGYKGDPILFDNFKRYDGK